jgi:elongation factor P hydroxylase
MDSAVLERIFEECFAVDYRTILVGGGSEPVYLPSDDLSLKPHRIIYRDDFFASALHEVAHWCLAGPRRRVLEDYGYWYRPDGRNREEQEAFERAEVDPQALEWIFSDACGFAFNLSADNLIGTAGEGSTNANFEGVVLARKERYSVAALPIRAESFRAALLRVHPPTQSTSTPLRSRPQSRH